jgi:hypothetical protein
MLEFRIPAYPHISVDLVWLQRIHINVATGMGGYPLNLEIFLMDS